MLRQFVFNAIRIGIRLIDFVHRNDDRHFRRFRVLDSFDGLRHHAVVRRNHQNHDVRCLRTTCTHRGKRGVARGIQEGDHAVIGLHMVCTDVLGNATRFARRHFRGTDIVEQRGFTVVNVTHDGHNRRARLSLCAHITIAHYRFFQLVFTTQDNFVAHLFSNQLRGFLIDDLVDGRHRAELHHRFDNLRAFYSHLVSKFSDGDGFTDNNVTVNRLSRLVEALLQGAAFTLAAFAAANGCTGFFTIRFGFGMLVAFLLACDFRRTRATTAAFYFTVAVIFCLTRML
ncbi:hypothetical protein BN131_2900 [Cronobacter malonaticus 681]|nr:hypothetical protein BN131_2900 [Cronobacter malonaticus 681]